MLGPVRFTCALGAVAVVGCLFLTVPMAKVPGISCLGSLTDGFKHFALVGMMTPSSLILEVDFMVVWSLVSIKIS